MYTHIDVDECEEGVCTHNICNNTDGGFQCGCRPGFTLASDGKSCLGDKIIDLMVQVDFN